MTDFTHLHVHTEYSLLDGMARIADLLAQAKALGMDSLAITDHGNMYGAMSFYQAARRAGIKPIIGMEAYMAAQTIADRTPQDKNPAHLILLAKDHTGYRNLIKLTTIANTEGFYYKPRIDHDLLARHHQGLVALSACAAGEVPTRLLAGDEQGARQIAAWYREVFGPDYYLEVQEHGIPELKDLTPQLIALGRALDIPLVATNDSHYIHRADAEYHNVLLAIQTQSVVDDPKRMRMYGDSFYLKSGAEMAALFAELPECLRHTRAIAEKCDLRLDASRGRLHLPDVEVPPGLTELGYLTALCEQGLRQKYDPVTPEAEDRLRYELEVIDRAGFVRYILIVRDFAREARERGIPFGVRGSAAGSIVCYCLGITDVDPLAWQLPFERFLNIERHQMPDVDMDFADNRRGEMIDYTIQKYGADHVAQIVTFGTLGARAAIRDVGRALDMPLGEVDRIARMVPLLPVGITIDQALAESRELQQAYAEDAHVRTLIDTARGLEGVARHASVHAAGVVIARDALIDHVPLQRATRGDEESNLLLTQYPAEDLETIGLLKMDFLGLANLTILGLTVDLIRQNRGIAIDIHNIPLNDQKTFAMLGTGETTGVFQLESAGMRRNIRALRPGSVEELAALIALYRPGPMDQIPVYIDNKFGRAPVTYLHDKLRPILEPTYGIIVYQDQVMFIAQAIAGYTLGQADILRRAMGKKKKEVMDQERDKFIAGAKAQGVDAQTATQIFELMAPFAGYGFNKCVTGDTRIVDYDTGRVISVAELWQRGRAGHPLGRTLTLSAEHQLGPGTITGVAYNGRKPVYRLITRSGRSITATANHPFLCLDGWRNLGDLRLGDRIAVPRRLPYQPHETMDEHQLVVLGYLLAEGNLCHPSGFYFYSTSEAEYTDYVTHLERFANTKGTVDASKSAVAVYARRADVRQPSEAVEWVKSLGLSYKKATEKFVPDQVFALPAEQIAVILGKLFQGDGCIVNDLKHRHCICFYATSSRQLAHDIQHLLLRLNVRSTLSTKQFKYRGAIKPGYVVQISDEENLRRFLQAIGKHLVGEKLSQAQRLPAGYWTGDETPATRAVGVSDTIPVQALPLIQQEMAARGLSVAEMVRRTGLAERLFYRDAVKRGFSRAVVRAIAHELDSPALKRLADSDLFWDEVIAIEPAGEQDTFDLTIADTHNFVANDIIVHNSHAACYALLAYQTAYLKANYPVEYMTALLTTVSENHDKIAGGAAECARLGITLLPPDVNESIGPFSVAGPDRIRYGLNAIKNVGSGAVTAIVAAREAGGPFTSLEDFCRRVDARQINRKVLESLIKAGALDRLGNRAQLLEILEPAMAQGQSHQQAARAGQLTMFDCLGAGALPTAAATFIPLPDLADVPAKTKLYWEKELLGTYFSEHPLGEVITRLGHTITAFCGEIDAEHVGQSVTVAGMVSSIRRIVTRKGEDMAFAQLEDLHGSVEVVIFPRVYVATADLWTPDQILLVQGKVESRNDKVQLVCSHAEQIRLGSAPELDDANPPQLPAEEPAQPVTHMIAERPALYEAPPDEAESPSPPANGRCRIHITLHQADNYHEDIRRLRRAREALLKYPGQDQFYFYLVRGQDQICIEFPNDHTGFCPQLERELHSIVGRTAVTVERVTA